MSETLMYCPQCGMENRPNQKYCRNCGLSLPAVQLAMQGTVDRAMTAVASEMDRLSGGAATLVIFALIALATCLFSEVSAAINLILGLLIGGPMIYRGIKNTARLVEQLNPEKHPLPHMPAHQPPLTNNPAAELPAVSDTDEIPSRLPQESSITDQTTFKLKLPR